MLSDNKRIALHEFKLSPLMAQFVAAQATGFEVALAESLAEPPKLETYLAKLDPNLDLDWSGESFWGLPELRRRILAAYGYTAAGIISEESHTLITAGSAEAIFLTLSQTLSPGDEIIVETPGWQQPLHVAPALGAKVIEWPRVEARGWAIDLESLPGLISARTRVIYLSNPNNPTGNIATGAEIDRLVEIAKAHDILILSDEVYRGLEWDRSETPRMAERYHRGASVGSVSKLFGMQGLRTGWIISQDEELIQKTFAMRANSTEIPNRLGEVIANAALEPESFQISRTRAVALGQAMLATLDAIIHESDAIDWHRPQGGLLGFARIVAQTGDQFGQKLLQPPHRLWVIPGSVYGYPQHIRLGIGGNPQRVEQALIRFADFLGVQMPSGTQESTPLNLPAQTYSRIDSE